MKNEIFIKVKSDNKIYKSDSSNLETKLDDEVLFESDGSQDTGIVVSKETAKEQGAGENDTDVNVTVIRKLTPKDKEKIEERVKEAKETLELCKEKIQKHVLEMNLLGADLSYDGKKLTFYFTSPGRVDFRSLVPDLASTFKKLIRLQQVGARDKAKCLGTVGRCGQGVCCKRFLKGDLESVTLDMASEQNLGQMGSNRVTGACGKLMCCLKFELEYYEEAKKKLPPVDSEIKTADGAGIVLSQNVIKKTVLVKLKKDNRIVEENC